MIYSWILLLQRCSGKNTEGLIRFLDNMAFFTRVCFRNQGQSWIQYNITQSFLLLCLYPSPHKLYNIWPWTRWFEFDALHQRKRPYIYTFIKIIALKQMIRPDFLNYSEVSVHLATKYVLQNLWSFNFHKCKNLYVSLWQFRVFNVHFLLVMDCAILSWGIFTTNAFSWKKSPGL